MPHRVRPHCGVVIDRCKLVHFYGTDADYWELFDLKTDPQELSTVYGVSKYAAEQKRLKDELTRLRKELQAPETDDPAASGNNPSK